MNARRLPAALAVALLSATLGVAADDAYGDPIPEGAKLRLGTARMRHATTGTPNALTPDGKFLVGGGGRGLTYVDTASGKVAREVRIEDAFGSLVAFSDDGRRAVATEFSSAWVCDAQTGKVLAKVSRSVPSREAGVSLSADGKRLAVGGVKSFDEKDKDRLPTAIVWDVDGNKQLARIAAAQNDTVYVALAADGTRLATWGVHSDRDAKEPPKPENDPNQLIQFWDAATGKEVAKARLPTRYTPSAVIFSRDGSLAAAASGEGSIHLLDPATGVEKAVLLGRSRQGRALAFSPDGKTLAAGGDDGSVQRWSVPGGKRLGTTESPGHRHSPRGLVFADNDRVLAWAARDSVSLVWEAPSGKLVSPAGGHRGPVVGAAVVGKEVVTTATDGGIIRWELATGKELGTLALRRPTGGFGPDVVTNEVGIAPDATRALAGDGFGGIGVHELPGGAQEFVIPSSLARDGHAVFTPDGAKLIHTTRTYDARKIPVRVSVWDVSTGKRLGGAELPDLWFVAAALSPDGKTLVTAGVRADDKNKSNPKDFVVAGWELATGKKLGEYVEPGGFGTPGVAAAGGNRTAVVATAKRRAIVVDVAAGTEVRELDLGKRQADGTPVVGPDGKTVAIPTGGGFGEKASYSVVLIDIESGKTKKTLAGLTGTPTAIAFSPDGKTLVTGCADTTALVWDVAGQ